MRTLVAQASGRTKGNTARLDSLLETALKAEAAEAGAPLEFETIALAKSDVQFCRGCRSCFDRGEATCPLKDDLLSIKAKMEEADVLILSGPVYVNDVNGVMKNWIDRLAHVCHRPAFAGKTALLLATTGGTPARHALRTMQVALWTWGYRVANSLSFAAEAEMSEAELRRRFLRPSLVSLMVFRIQQAGWRKAAADSLDHAYGNGKGWLDARHCTYFFPHRANPITTITARLIGALVGVFVT